MSSHSRDFANFRRKLLCVAIAGCIALPANLPALAASVALATAPLATSTTSVVKPNVMFILDDSGSMGDKTLPDWASDNDPVTGTAYDAMPPLFRNAQFNGVAYNPAITYVPPTLFTAAGVVDTTTYPSMASPWTSVKNDGYGIQSASTTNLITSFPDIQWCTDSTYTTCLRNDNLILPGTVGGVAYNTSQSKNSTGTGNVVSGPPDAPTTAMRTFGPFYYKINPGEFCTGPDLKNCQTTQTAMYNTPANVRWCNSAAQASNPTPTAGNCQGINSVTFNYPRYPTKFFTAGSPFVPAVPAVVAVTAVFPTGLITFSGTTTSGSSAATINRSRAGTNTITLGGARVSNANPLTIGTSRTPAQAAAAVVAVIGTGGSVKAYIGGNPITAVCAGKSTSVVCLVDTTTYTNGSAVAIGSTSNFGGVSVTTTATAGGVTPVTGSPFIPAVAAGPAGY